MTTAYLVLVLVLLSALLWRQRQVRIRGAWQAIADRHELELARSPEHDFPMLTGRYDGLAVTIYDTGHAPSDPTRVVVRLPGPPRRLQLETEVVVATRKLIGGEPAPLNHDHVRLGDPEFERRCTVSAEVIEALSVLDTVARRLLGSICHRPPTRQFGGARVAISAEAIVLDEAGLLRWNSQLDDRLRDLSLLAGHLGRMAAEPAERLAAHAEGAGLGTVRRRVLLVLLRHFADTAPAAAAAQLALADDDVELQLAGAIALGESAFDRVLEMAQMGGSPEHRVTALQFLGRYFTADRIERVLARADRADIGAVERLAIREAGRQRLPHLTTRLLELLDPEDAVTASAIALALGWIGDAAAAAHGVERRLVELLSAPDDHLRRAAAEALGRVGGPGAIGPLRVNIQGWENPRLNQDMRAAIAAIERRGGQP